jgi:endonuclease/exonuclease/phosphatase family metal-dependent hydrolase
VRTAEQLICPELYAQLNGLLSIIPLRNFLVVLGDFNALIPSTHSNFSLDLNSNENSDFMHYMVNEHQLFDKNSHFQKPAAQHVTFYGPNNRRVTLDHILIRTKWKTSANNTSIERPKTVSSDQNLLI